MNCIFCKIVRGELAAHKIYEDSETLAFLDIYPMTDGHTLVIPKLHTERFSDLPQSSLVSSSKQYKKSRNASPEHSVLQHLILGSMTGARPARLSLICIFISFRASPATAAALYTLLSISPTPVR